jgi:two-component system sensor histidine kinase EvgS
LKNFRKLRVLVVDDHAPNRMVITQQLQFLGHEVAVAQDGEIAMKLWAPGFFDLIITDCNMPIVNGYELARKIRMAEQDNPDIAQCTIFGFTANAQAEEIVRCREAGMNDCLFKPIGLEMLRDRLALVDSVRAPDSIDSDGKILAPPAGAKIFDRETLDQLTGGNAAIAEDLLREMIKSNQQDLSQMHQHLQDAEWGGILDGAHRVKGGARITKADSLIAACTALESACHEPVNEVEVFEKVETVCTEIRKLEAVLSEELSRLES